jgi:hypothetical protein
MVIRVPGWLIAFALGMTAGAAMLFAVSGVTAAKTPPPWEEWSLPARFEGHGALTLGCSFWDVPSVTGYSDENPRTDLVMVAISGERGDVEALFSIDGPHGTSFVGGEKCAVSVDWSAFPERERPAD